MILKNTSNVVISQRTSDRPALVLRKCNPAVVFVDT